MSIKKILDIRNDHPEARCIFDYAELEKKVILLKEMGFKVVLTQGVWDLTHLAHIRYLKAAAACGDILVVGVDSDELTRKRKGPGRPLTGQDERIEHILAFRFVDIVTLRNADDDLTLLIKVVKPDVLVVSETTKDFAKEAIEDVRSFCGEIRALPPQAAVSTTSRLRNLMLDGAQGLKLSIEKVIDEYLGSLRQ